MNILHVFNYTNKIFSAPFIQFINKYFAHQNHIFIIQTFEDTVLSEDYTDNVEYINKNQYNVLIKKMYKSDKIILHSLTTSKLTGILFLRPWLLKKCYWVIWGGDLYYHDYRKKTIKSDLYELVRKYVIRNFGGLITQIKGDYLLAKKWYGVKGKYYYSFLYPSNLYKEHISNKNMQKLNKTYIQIGNSADPGNEHMEIFQKLSKYKDSNIEIICPLSYGNEENAHVVTKEGERIFDKKFTPLLELLPEEEYTEILERVNIAIFNHNRQQAMGNIITLLGLGKKVYIRDNITTWRFCLDHDLTVFTTNGDFNNLLEEFDEETKQKNIRNIKKQFSEEKLIKDWEKIFNEEI